MFGFFCLSARKGTQFIPMIYNGQDNIEPGRKPPLSPPEEITIILYPHPKKRAAKTGEAIDRPIKTTLDPSFVGSRRRIGV